VIWWFILPAIWFAVAIVIALVIGPTLKRNRERTTRWPEERDDPMHDYEIDWP
jgi:hypothetical protein